MNTNKKIVIATDHRGYAFKEYIKSITRFSCNGVSTEVTWLDVGALSAERSDYPVFAQQAIKKMHQDNIDKAILLCGSGNGMAIAANRFKGIFACVAWSGQVAQMAKEDDNCNVLVLPADYIQQEEITEIISSWLCSEFKSGRYAERLALIDVF